MQSALAGVNVSVRCLQMQPTFDDISLTSFFLSVALRVPWIETIPYLETVCLSICNAETGALEKEGRSEPNTPPTTKLTTVSRPSDTGSRSSGDIRREMSPVIGLWCMLKGNRDSPLFSLSTFPEDFQTCPLVYCPSVVMQGDCLFKSFTVQPSDALVFIYLCLFSTPCVCRRRTFSWWW